MNKILLVLFFILLSTFGYSQNEDKETIANKARIEGGPNFSARQCESYLNLAERKIKNDSLILPLNHLGNFQSETFKKLIKKEFKIFDWDIVSGDVIPFETKCFDNFMFQAIEKKYGKNFLEKQKMVADSLDKMGIGYIKPKFKGAGNSLSQFISKSLNIDSLEANRPGHKILLFYIDQKGKVKRVILFEGSGVANAVNKADKLQLKLTEIFKKSPKWDPAKFLGQPIESHFFYEIKN